MTNHAARDDLLHRLLEDVSRGVVCRHDDEVRIDRRPTDLAETLGLTTLLVREWMVMGPVASGKSLCLLTFTGFTVLSAWDRELAVLNGAGLSAEDERFLLHLSYTVHLDPKG